MTVILSERELCSLAQLGTNSLTLVRFRAELQCPAMDDDSLDEFEDQTPGPDAHPPLSAAALARDAEESSDSDSGGSEDDTGSELSDSSDGEDEEGDLEDGSGKSADVWAALL